MYLARGNGSFPFFLLGESLSFIFSLEEYVLREEGSSFYRLDEE